jgi:hypothetical protein
MQEIFIDLFIDFKNPFRRKEVSYNDHSYVNTVPSLLSCLSFYRMRRYTELAPSPGGLHLYPERRIEAASFHHYGLGGGSFHMGFQAYGNN